MSNLKLQKQETKTTEYYRKLCLKQQTELRCLIMNCDQHDKAIQLFLHQHAMLHSARMARTEPWSFEDAVFGDMSDEQIRHIPGNGEHSAAWLLWHMTRCEDITMNLLVAGSPQVLHRGNRLARLKITARDTGNAMNDEEIAAFSRAVDIKALRDYRVAVGRRTRAIVKRLEPEELKRKVDPWRLQRVWDERAVAKGASGIVDYWSKRNIAGLLLMPATRHNLIHLNEALQLKRTSD